VGATCTAFAALYLTAVVESGYTGNVPYKVLTEAEAQASYGFDAGNRARFFIIVRLK
jgi:hypothetical protein